MALTGNIDEAFLGRYRALLDAEDAAFDQLEHCYEDGDRASFDDCIKGWRSAVDRKLTFLHKAGFLDPPALNV